jgi:uncharacterized protein (TIGR03067 family)
MKKSLPARPNLEHLRTQAKQLLSELRAGDAGAARALTEYLPAARRMTPEEVRSAGFRLADAQSAIARKSGFAAWPSLARHVEQLRAFEGEWQFVSLEVDGAAMPAPMTAQSCLLIDGDRFRMESPEAHYEGVFTIDVEADTPHIDIEFVEGPEAGNWSYGIYELDGDDLLLCLGLTGAPRPARFATTAGSGHALERLRRTSPTQPANVSGGRGTDATPPLASTPLTVDEAAFGMTMTPLLKQLQGEWTPVTLTTNGQPLAEAMLLFGSRTVTGNETKVIFGGQVMVHAKVRIDESRTPIGIDYLNVGPGAKNVTLGIIDFDGDVVRFCMAPAGGSRPAEFSSEKGSGRILSEWKRK